MKLEPFEDGANMRLVLTSFVTDSAFLVRIRPHWNEDRFSSPHANLIADSCVRYHDKHGKAPGPHIESILREKAQRKNPSTIKAIEEILEYLSDQYAQMDAPHNTDYVLGIARKIFRQTKLDRTIERAKALLQTDNLDEAEEEISKYSNQDIATQEETDLLQAKETIYSAYEQSAQSIIALPPGLAEFYDNSLARDSLIAYVAPEKTGKTYMLLDMAWRAMTQRLRVAFFEVGDMSEKQVIRRLCSRAAEHPLYPSLIRIPLTLDVKRLPGGGWEPHAATKEIKFKEMLNAETSWNAFQQVVRKKVKSNQSFFKLFTFPARSMSVSGIRSILKARALQGWLADVVIIDYADILADPHGYKMDKRDMINENWMQMRALSTEFQCLVLTATQCNRSGYNAEYLTLDHNSDDKRKAAHVTGMIGLLAKESERQLGVMRMNWMARREEQFSVSRRCWMAGCLAISNPAILAQYPANQYEKKTTEEDDE